MNKRIFALVVHDRPDPFRGLEQTLKDLSVVTRNVRTCEEVGRLITQIHPQIVFTDTCLPDGTWADVVSLANKSAIPVNVIVVSSNQDLQLYLSTIEGGAFDFVLPPFEHHALDYIVRTAAQEARRREEASERPTATA